MSCGEKINPKWGLLYPMRFQFAVSFWKLKNSMFYVFNGVLLWSK